MTPHPKQLSENELKAELLAAGAKFKGRAMHCLCPENHRNGDKTPSAGVFQGQDGVYRWHCQSCGEGGDVFDVQSKRTGRPLAEILRENAQDKPQMKNESTPKPQAEKMTFASVEACYELLSRKYGGQLEALHPYPENFYTVRWRVSPDKKEMRPLVKQGEKYAMKFPEGKRPLYRRDDLAGARTVVVCEGEQKCDVLAEYSFPATTSAGGSSQASCTDWQPLAGKNIIIWPDADAAGSRYAEDVRKICEALGCNIKIIEPSKLDLRDGEDVVDYVRQLKNAGYDDIAIKQSLIESFRNKAQSTGPASELDCYYSDVISGKIQPILTGFKTLDGLIQITPESLTLICGSPGASKSLWMLQLLAYWISQGVRAACFMLERGRPFHLARVLAQAAGVAQLTRMDWIKVHPDLVREAMAEHREHIDTLGRALWVDPDNPAISQADVLNWAKQRAETGHKVLLIDPVTLRTRSGDAWSADEDLIRGLKGIASQYKCAIITVLHPAKGQAMPDLSSLSGGAIFGRACDCALWLEHHTEGKKSTVALADGYEATREIEHDRSIIVLKSRDGSGTGARIACSLSADTLKLTEIGMTLKTKGK